MAGLWDTMGKIGSLLMPAANAGNGMSMLGAGTLASPPPAAPFGSIEGRSGDEGIFKAPPDPFVRRNLDFDKMDPDWIYDRGRMRVPNTILHGKRIK